MAVTSVGDLFEALGSGDFERILGTPESDWIEFKGEIYPLDTIRGKYELAKDVAGFQNAGGGVIVLGVATTRRESEFRDTASEVRGVPPSLVNSQQYHHVLESHTNPPAVDVPIHTYSIQGQDRVLLAIEVRAGRDPNVLVVINRVVDETEGSVQAVAIPERTQGGVRWYSAEEIQHIIADGLRYRVRQFVPEAVEVRDLTHMLDSDNETATRLGGWVDVPTIVLQAAISGWRPAFSQLYGDAGIAQSMRTYERLRANGFNFGGDSPLQPAEGGQYFEDGTGRIVFLSDSGGLTVGAPVTENFFATGMQSPSDAPQLNSRALVEYALEFCIFVDEHMRNLTDGGETVLTVRCSDFASVRLAPGLDRFVTQQSLSDSAHTRLVASGEAAADAYSLLTPIYGLFAFAPERIPLSSKSEIDGDAIRRL